MRTTKRWAFTGTAIAALFGASLLNGPMAAADSSASISGARATFTSHGEVFKLYDTSCDGNPVYLRYKINGGSENRLDYSGGCDTHASYNLSFAEGARVEYRACVDIRPGVDRCSGWSSDRA